MNLSIKTLCITRTMQTNAKPNSERTATAHCHPSHAFPPVTYYQNANFSVLADVRPNVPEKDKIKAP